MNGLPRKKITELIARYTLEPNIKDIYVDQDLSKDSSWDWITYNDIDYSLETKSNNFLIKKISWKITVDVWPYESLVKKKIFDKPEDYFNLDKLRKAVKADRRITLKEFIEKIFGGINKFKTKDELLEEEFEKFISIYKPESKYVPYIKNYLKL